MKTTLTKKAIKQATQSLNLAVALHATGSMSAVNFAVQAADILGVRIAGNDIATSLDILRCEVARVRALSVSVAMFESKVSQ